MTFNFSECYTITVDNDDITPLYVAADNGEAVGGRTEVLCGPNKLVTTKSVVAGKFETPLHQAVLKGNYETAVAIFEAKKAAFGGDFYTPLHEAVLSVDLSAVRAMLKACCSVDVVDNNGGNVLHVVAEGSKVEMIRELVSIKCDSNAACDVGLVYVVDRNGFGILHDAAHSGHAREMLSTGCDIHEAVTDGKPSLHVAAKKWITIAVRHGTEKAIIVGEFGNQFLQAAGSGHLFPVKVMLKASFPVDMVGSNGDSVLHFAPQDGKKLFSTECDVNYLIPLHVEEARYLLCILAETDVQNTLIHQLDIPHSHWLIQKVIMDVGGSCNVSLASEAGYVPQIGMIGKNGMIVCIPQNTMQREVAAGLLFSGISCSSGTCRIQLASRSVEMICANSSEQVGSKKQDVAALQSVSEEQPMVVGNKSPASLSQEFNEQFHLHRRVAMVEAYFTDSSKLCIACYGDSKAPLIEDVLPKLLINRVVGGEPCQLLSDVGTEATQSKLLQCDFQSAYNILSKLLEVPPVYSHVIDVVPPFTGQADFVSGIESTTFNEERAEASWFTQSFVHEEVLDNICFAFQPKTLYITSAGGVFIIEAHGIQIEVPPGAVSPSESVPLRYAVILDGPFTLPKGYRLGSTVVYIYYDGRRVTKPIKLCLPHWYGGKDHVRDGLSFAMAPHKLEEGEEHYHFELLAGGQFEEHGTYGVLYIDGHNSLFTEVYEQPATSRYMVSFWQNEEDGIQCRAAITYESVTWCEVGSTAQWPFCSYCECTLLPATAYLLLE